MGKRTGRAVLVVALGAVLVVTGQAAAVADEPTAPAVEPSISWATPTVETEVARGLDLVATIEAVDPATTSVVVERRRADGQDLWDAVASRTEGSRVTATVPGDAATYRARLVREGRTIAESTTAVTTRPARTRATLTLPRSVRDYSKVTAKVGWTRLFDGRGISGTAVLEYKPTRTAKYRTRAKIRLRGGVGSFRYAPRNDGWYRVRVTGNTRLTSSASGRRWIDNRPPGKAVVLPKGAPRPTYRLPKQARATRIAVDARISPISDRVWRSMKGRSWHRGCPVGRGSLRVVRVSYWSYDGYVRRGEIVVNRSVARRTARVFADLFRQRTPIRSMYRVDRFGWSKGLRGADDVKSMRAGNTSGFNCRQVVGNTSVRSPHSYGRSIDINPWENPYWAGRWYPNSWWHSRSKPAAVTWRSPSDPVVKIFRKHGFGWLGVFDLHHFQD